jgi:hypothetical protein
MALIHEDQGLFQEALRLNEKACAIFTRVFGEDSKDVATVFQNMATIHLEQGSFQEAINHHCRALNCKAESKAGTLSHLQEALRCRILGKLQGGGWKDMILVEQCESEIRLLLKIASKPNDSNSQYSVSQASVLFHLTAFDGLAISEDLLDSIRLRSAPLHDRLKKKHSRLLQVPKELHENNSQSNYASAGQTRGPLWVQLSTLHAMWDKLQGQLADDMGSRGSWISPQSTNLTTEIISGLAHLLDQAAGEVFKCFGSSGNEYFPCKSDKAAFDVSWRRKSSKHLQCLT